MSFTEQHQGWQKHYGRKRSKQSYPDENLVRIVSKIERGAALDYGCGSGRHLLLLRDYGFSPIYGADSSEEAVRLSSEVSEDAILIHVTQESEELKSRIPQDSLQLLVLWGVLHYNRGEEATALLKRLLLYVKQEGWVAGTLRAKSETHIQQNPDMEGVNPDLYSLEEAEHLLRLTLKDVKLGYSERTPLGELNRKVCHWFFTGRNP